ncbi:hypothetical protein V6N13_144077 [Hibiscus sabdariffa]
MEVATFFSFILIIISILLSALIFKSIVQKRKTPRNLPPSPPALPIIGHLHLLKQPVHRTLHQLSEKYGPVLLLQFGTRKVLLVSSASAAEECFTRNDIIFANRPQLLAGKHMNYNNSTIGLAPYGDYWRNLRRLTTMELFSTSRLAMFARIRQEEVQLLLKELFQLASTGKPAKVQLTSKLIEVVFNIILRIIAGKRYYGKDAVDKEAEEFRDMMREAAEIHGSAHLNDFFPLLQWVDFQGVERRMKGAMEKLDKFLQALLEEHRKMREDSAHQHASNKDTETTLIDIMLSLQQTEPEFYTDQTIKAVILSFEWNRIGEEEIDMKEGTGLTMPKAEPLVALCSPRPGMLNLLSMI